MKEIIITQENCNQRIDKFVRKYLNNAPLSFIYKTFRKKDVKINGKWKEPSYILVEGDVLRIYVTDEQVAEFNKPRNIEDIQVKLEIIYEDDNLLIVCKPKGILIFGDDNEKRITLTNKVQAYLFQKGEFKNNGQGYNPSPVHRLDRNTSGIIMFAKNAQTSQTMMDLLRDKKNIDKYYIALVNGVTPKKGRIEIPLKKDSDMGMVKPATISEGGKEAITEYEKVAGNDKYSLLKIRLITGRTHQIRAHFKEIGYPLVGDGKYGNFACNKDFKEKFKYSDQFLHAYEIRFHNVEGHLSYISNKTFKAKLPEKESEILKRLGIDNSF